MTHDDIRDLYRRADYSKPKLLQVLADVAGVTVKELKIIIEEENILKWTDKQNELYNRMTAEGATINQIANAMGVKIQSIHQKRYREKNQDPSARKGVKPDKETAPEMRFDDRPFQGTEEPTEVPVSEPAAGAPRNPLFLAAHDALERMEAIAAINGIDADYIMLTVDQDGFGIEAGTEGDTKHRNQITLYKNKTLRSV